MAEQVRISKQFRLDWVDLGKGLIMAAGSAVVTFILESSIDGHLTFDWAKIGSVAGIAAFTYISKNYFEPTKTIIKEVPAPTPPTP